MQNIDFRTWITSLYGSQTSPVDLWMQNNVISIRNTSLYGSHSPFVVFECKTSTLGPELQVSMGPRPHRWFFCIRNSVFSTRIASLYLSLRSSEVLCIRNSVIMTRINSLYGSQNSPVVFCMHNSVINTRNTSLHVCQTSPVVLCMQNNVISTRNTSLYGSQPSSVFFVHAKQRD